MNAMIRAVKSGTVLAAVAGLGVALRWVTAGTVDAASQQDLASLAELAVGAISWTAYAWLVLAITATTLEQLPGVLGRMAGALAGRITSSGARALLRSTLGIAAVTPLTIGVAHAAGPDAAYTAIERASSLDLSASPGTGYHGVEPPSQVSLDPTVSRQAVRREPARPRIAVPDRPTIGAPTRYTDIRRRPDQVVVRPAQVVVQPGDSLWSITTAELGSGATDTAVAARWPDWYAANATVIGPDPDHLQPGQVLRMPSTPQEK
jgi:nucleoid-associated protein YgaU